MRFGLAYTIIFTVLSCQRKESIPLFVSKSSPEISNINDVVYYKKSKFNGVLYELNEDAKDTLFKQEIKDGLINGVSIKWYPSHQLMEYREYERGRKNGNQIAYWENGNKRFEFIAQNDAYEGEMKEWTIDGKLFHLAHFENGQEEGSQKMWYENGKIRANYVILSGKRYGLLGTKNCKNVSDSIFSIK